MTVLHPLSGPQAAQQPPGHSRGAFGPASGVTIGPILIRRLRVAATGQGNPRIGNRPVALNRAEHMVPNEHPVKFGLVGSLSDVPERHQICQRPKQRHRQPMLHHTLTLV